jgi:phosphate transport system protein
MADDLRELVAALKLSAVIERIGDYAKNIAKRVGQIDSRHFLDKSGQLRQMGEIAAEMVRSAMDAYAKRDVDLARAVTNRDDAVDQLYKDLFVDFIGFVAKNPHAAAEIAHLLFISKNLERVGDHSTNCAQMIYFTETGQNLPED